MAKTYRWEKAIALNGKIMQRLFLEGNVELSGRLKPCQLADDLAERPQ
jgi:hypothetical protein